MDRTRIEPPATAARAAGLNGEIAGSRPARACAVSDQTLASASGPEAACMPTSPACARAKRVLIGPTIS